MWAVIGLVLGASLPFLGILFLLNQYEQRLPDITTLEDIEFPLATEVYSRDGVKLAEFASERRIWVSLDEVSPKLILALMAAEDRSFYDHWGVSSRGIIRAFFTNIKAGSIVQGGSTLTQQMAKNLFLTPEKKYERKIMEALTAILIERRYAKGEILEIYLNQNNMGFGCYGVEAAAQYHFGKGASQLNVDEAAFLAGFLKAPSYYTRNMDRAMERKDIILGVMKNEGIIPPDQADSLLSCKMNFLEKKQERGWKYPYFVSYIRQYLLETRGEDFLYKSGSRIYTTLDTRIQDIAETAVRNKVKALRDARSGKKVQGAALVLEPQTGFIFAMVGGYDWEESQFNRATQAKRQPGSAFKPFVYTAAIDNGYQPSMMITDKVDSFPDGTGEWYKPGNYDGKYLGKITLRQSLMKSRNLSTIRLANRIGIKTISQYAKALGIESTVTPYLSSAIGASEVTMLEITGAYSTFANGGFYATPSGVVRIEDRDGNVLFRSIPSLREGISAGVAYVMVDMMKSVMELSPYYGAGTGYGARSRGFTRVCAGKTGTTNDYSDAWFIGFTPQLCASVWVGYDNVVSLGKGQSGSTAALPIWTDIMKGAYEDEVLAASDSTFEIPEMEVIFMDICPGYGYPYTNQCPKPRREVFLLKNPIPVKGHDDDTTKYIFSTDIDKLPPPSEDIDVYPVQEPSRPKPQPGKPGL